MAETVFPAVILAGGQGRRIGGDKARVALGGRPLWQHVAERVGPQVSALAVNGPEALGGLPVVSDAVPDLGPLGGILAAMLWARGSGEARVLTVAVDTPFLPTDLAARLSAEKARITVAATDDGVHGTTALWDVALADDLRKALEAGTRKVTVWAEGVGYQPVHFDNAQAFFNINTPDDLARAEALI